MDVSVRKIILSEKMDISPTNHFSGFMYFLGHFILRIPP